MILLVLGCLPEVGTVTMYGNVHDAPNAEGSLVEGATLETKNQALEVIGTATTDFAGEFEVDVPEGSDFFVEVRGDGYVPTHFSGVAGIYDFSSGEGYPWVAPTEWVDELRTTFAACPNVDAEGVIVTGEMRLYIDGARPSDCPIIDSGEVYVYNSDDEVVASACYLDDAGTSLADGTITGDTGRFAVFGVPPGLIAVEVVYNDPSGDQVSSHPQYAPAEGGLVPMYPAWAYVSAQ